MVAVQSFMIPQFVLLQLARTRQAQTGTVDPRSMVKTKKARQSLNQPRIGTMTRGTMVMAMRTSTAKVRRAVEKAKARDPEKVKANIVQLFLGAALPEKAKVTKVEKVLAKAKGSMAENAMVIMFHYLLWLRTQHNILIINMNRLVNPARLPVSFSLAMMTAVALPRLRGRLASPSSVLRRLLRRVMQHRRRKQQASL